jgi:hypothetical protein
MKQLWQCEKCDEKFSSKEHCLEHEQECKLLCIHTCDKCGKVTEYIKINKYDSDYVENKCWTFTPNHYRAGYGSKLDGSEFVLHLCDDCLYEFVSSCVHEERICNTGSNTYYDYPDYEETDEDETSQ